MELNFIFCNDSLNLYNYILDTLTAIGTVGAVIISLWLALREKKYEKFEIQGFVFPARMGQISFTVHNNGDRLVKIKEVGLYVSMDLEEKNKKKFSKLVDMTPIHYTRNIGKQTYIDENEYKKNREDFEYRQFEKEQVDQLKIILPYEHVYYIGGHKMQNPGDKNENLKQVICFAYLISTEGYEVHSEITKMKVSDSFIDLVNLEKKMFEY